MKNEFRNRLIHLLQTTGQLEGRADDVADAIITEFGFTEFTNRGAIWWASRVEKDNRGNRDVPDLPTSDQATKSAAGGTAAPRHDREDMPDEWPADNVRPRR